MAKPLLDTAQALLATHPAPWKVHVGTMSGAVVYDGNEQRVFDDGSAGGELAPSADVEVMGFIVDLVNGIAAAPAPPEDEDSRFQLLQWSFSKADAEAFLPVQTPKHPDPDALAATMAYRVLAMLELYGDDVVAEMASSGWMARFLVPLRETRPWNVAEVLYWFRDNIFDIEPLINWLLDQIRADGAWCSAIITEVMDDTSTSGCWLYGELTS